MSSWKACPGPTGWKLIIVTYGKYDPCGSEHLTYRRIMAAARKPAQRDGQLRPCEDGGYWPFGSAACVIPMAADGGQAQDAGRSPELTLLAAGCVGITAILERPLWSPKSWASDWFASKSQ